MASLERREAGAEARCLNEHTLSSLFLALMLFWENGCNKGEMKVE
jgi:hypothetical protein